MPFQNTDVIEIVKYKMEMTKRKLIDYSELMKEWDFEANDRDPSTITYGSSYRAKWICSRCGNHFVTEVRERIKGRNCQKCRRPLHTSFMEQAILFYTRKCFDVVENRYKKVFLNGMELDIYIPSIKVGIEFDGAYFHQRPEQKVRDAKKYQLCKEKGIMLIRISEDSREPFEIKSDYFISLNEKVDSKTKNEAIICLLSLLLNRDGLLNVQNHLVIVDRISNLISVLDID